VLSFILRHEVIGDRSLSAIVPFFHEGRSYSHKLIPGQLFGIGYGSRKLFFLLEFDRPTEMISCQSFERKSFLRSLLQYRQFVGGQLTNRITDLMKGWVVIFLTTSSRQLGPMLDVTMKTSSGTGNAYMLFKCLPPQGWTLKILYVDSLQNRGCVRARTASNCTRYDRTGGRTKSANVMLFANRGSLAVQHGDITHDNACPP